MSNGMNQKVDTWLALALIAVLAGAVAVFALSDRSMRASKQTQIQIPKAVQKPQASEKGSREKACLASGGTVSVANCCKTSGDFPNSCLIGACGCAPASSHQVKSCNCGAGKCFDGNSCISVGSSASKTGLNEKEINSAVFSAVNTITKGVWDRKVEINSVNDSKKAAKGYWWAKDSWEWIAWQQDGNKWNVIVSTDGFDSNECKKLDSIPSQYNNFFHDVIYKFGKKNCY